MLVNKFVPYPMVNKLFYKKKKKCSAGSKDTTPKSHKRTGTVVNSMTSPCSGPAPRKSNSNSNQKNRPNSKRSSINLD
jgi:hypothetical protein